MASYIYSIDRRGFLSPIYMKSVFVPQIYRIIIDIDIDTPNNDEIHCVYYRKHIGKQKVSEKIRFDKILYIPNIDNRIFFLQKQSNQCNITGKMFIEDLNVKVTNNYGYLEMKNTVIQNNSTLVHNSHLYFEEGKYYKIICLVSDNTTIVRVGRHIYNFQCAGVCEILHYCIESGYYDINFTNPNNDYNSNCFVSHVPTNICTSLSFGVGINYNLYKILPSEITSNTYLSLRPIISNFVENTNVRIEVMIEIEAQCNLTLKYETNIIAPMKNKCNGKHYVNFVGFCNNYNSKTDFRICKEGGDGMIIGGYILIHKHGQHEIDYEGSLQATIERDNLKNVICTSSTICLEQQDPFSTGEFRNGVRLQGNKYYHFEIESDETGLAKYICNNYNYTFNSHLHNKFVYYSEKDHVMYLSSFPESRICIRNISWNETLYKIENTSQNRIIPKYICGIPPVGKRNVFIFCRIHSNYEYDIIFKYSSYYLSTAKVSSGSVCIHLSGTCIYEENILECETDYPYVIENGYMILN